MWRGKNKQTKKHKTFHILEILVVLTFEHDYNSLPTSNSKFTNDIIPIKEPNIYIYIYTKLNVMDYVKLLAFSSAQIPIAFEIIINLDYIER